MTTPLNSRLAVVSILVPRVVSMAQREHEDLKGKNAREGVNTHGPASDLPTAHARVSSPQVWCVQLQVSKYKQGPGGYQKKGKRKKK